MAGSAAVAAASSCKNTALLLVDCQRSFIEGFWMSFVDPTEVQPLRTAFDRVADMLPRLSPDIHMLVTQCPFPTPKDFSLHPPVDNALAMRSAVTRVIKPGNSILGARGASKWLDEFAANSIGASVPTVVIAGCTLTSCVRVSALDIVQNYGGTPPRLRVCVDLSLCAARATNYIPRCPGCMSKYVCDRFSPRQQPCTCSSGEDLMSPVDKAVSDMRAAGVHVYDSFDWSFT